MAALSTKTERLEDNKVKFEVTVPAEEVKSFYKQAYQDTNRKNRIPGFRPGKAPRAVLDNAFGKDYFTAEATDKLLNAYFPAVVDDENMVSFGEPDMSIDEMAKENEDYTFTFTVEVKPEYELSSYDPIELELEPTEATESDIDEQIETFRNYYISFEPIEEKRGLEKDDIAKLELVCSSNGEPIPSMTTGEQPYEVGSGNMPETFDEGILGMKVDETREFDFSVSDDPLDTLATDGTIHCKATLHGIEKKILPDVTDEWVKEKLSYENVAELRDRLGKMVTSRKESMREQEKGYLGLEKLAERLEGEPTDPVIEEAEKKNYQDYFRTLQEQGMTLDSYLAQLGITADEYRQKMHEQAIVSARENLALDALVRHLGLEATDEEISDAFKEAGLDPAKSMAEWRSQGSLAFLREGIARDKAAKWVRENEKIVTVAAEDKKPAAKKTAAKKADKAEEAADEAKPAAKKSTAKKAAAKAEDAGEASAEKKPAAKKAAAKKAVKADDEAAEKKPAAEAGNEATEKKPAAKKPAAKKDAE